MQKILLIILLLLSGKTTKTKRDSVFITVSDLESLLQMQKQVIKSLSKYVKSETKAPKFIHQYLRWTTFEHEKAMTDQSYFENPINALSFLNRLGPDFNYIQKLLADKPGFISPQGPFPSLKDFSNLILGFIGMIPIYDLNITQLADGLLNSSVRSPMTATDCYNIGTGLIKFGELYKEAIPWLKQTYRKLEEGKCEGCPLSLLDITEFIGKAYNKLGYINNFNAWNRIRIFLKQGNKTLEYKKILNMAVAELEEFENPEKEIIRNPNPKKFVFFSTNLTEMCYGRIRTPRKYNKRISCYYAHGPHPYLILAPFKAETFHLNPDVTVFHQVLSDNEIQAIKSLAKPRIRNSTHSVVRNIKPVALEDEASDVVARVSQKAFQLSGLNTEDSESVQVLNYGIGGFYNTHFDTITKLQKQKQKALQRTATMIFYLSDVEQGGATIFPIIDVSVFPSKGSALFWMNQLPSGEKELLTAHGSCPVLRGSKWLAVKWPHRATLSKLGMCPVWKYKKRIVTKEIYTEILYQRENEFFIWKNSKNMDINMFTPLAYYG